MGFKSAHLVPIGAMPAINGTIFLESIPAIWLNELCCIKLNVILLYFGWDDVKRECAIWA